MPTALGSTLSTRVSEWMIEVQMSNSWTNHAMFKQNPRKHRKLRYCKDVFKKLSTRFQVRLEIYPQKAGNEAVTVVGRTECFGVWWNWKTKQKTTAKTEIISTGDEKNKQPLRKLAQNGLWRLGMKENTSYALIQNILKGSYPGLRLRHEHFVLETEKANVIRIAKKKL